MDALISAWGNSLGVRIPKTYAKEIGLKNGSRVELALDGDRLIIKPAKPKKYSLTSLVSQISSENCYDEMDFGRPEGREIW